MKTVGVGLVALLLGVLSPTAIAQPAPNSPPAGPADVMRAAQEANARAEQARTEAAADAELDDPGEGEPGEEREPAEPGANGGSAEQQRPPSLAERAALSRFQGTNEPIATSEPSSDVPVGSVRILVTNESGQPIAGQEVRIGVMRQAGSREQFTGTTDAQGMFQQDDLPGGSTQAYRVTVSYQGAKYGTTPFRLEDDRGQFARIRRVDTTDSTESVLLSIGQMMLEYKNERLHITEQVRLTNLGRRTVVFGNAGVTFSMPEGATAFQSQAVMTDQRLVFGEEANGEDEEIEPAGDGLHLYGSLPPGTVTLAWMYDVPLSGSSALLSRSLPFRTYRYRVISDAAEGMSMSVDGFPTPEVQEAQGRRVLMTSLERGPEQAALENVSVRIEGIPGPGPFRTIAVGLAFLLLIFGVFMAVRGADKQPQVIRARVRQRNALLAEAAELEQEFRNKKVGPKFYARERARIIDDLASLEQQDAAAKMPAAQKPSGAKRDTAGILFGAIAAKVATLGYVTFLSMQYLDVPPNPLWLLAVILAIAIPAVFLARRVMSSPSPVSK